jgi:hypothetical protein
VKVKFTFQEQATIIVVTKECHRDLKNPVRKGDSTHICFAIEGVQ